MSEQTNFRIDCSLVFGLTQYVFGLEDFVLRIPRREEKEREGGGNCRINTIVTQTEGSSRKNIQVDADFNFDVPILFVLVETIGEKVELNTSKTIKKKTKSKSVNI